MSDGSEQAYQEIAFTLAAGEARTFYLNGRSLTIDTLTGSGLQMAVSDGSYSNIQQGSGFQLPDGNQFKKIQFSNTSASSLTAIVAISNGLLSTRVSLSGSVSFKSGDTVATPALVTSGTAATLLVALNTSRRAVFIQNLSTSENLWVGDANVGNDAGGRGLKVLPGGSLNLATGAALYGRRGAAVDVSTSILEITA